jgi:hypothetical protein
MVSRPHTIRVWDARTLRQVAQLGKGQPEFMISLFSGDDPQRLLAELERMGVMLQPPEETHLSAAGDGLETIVRVHREARRKRRRGEQANGQAVVFGWVPDLPGNAITPYTWHSRNLVFAIAHGSDLRLYRLESE